VRGQRPPPKGLPDHHLSAPNTAVNTLTSRGISAPWTARTLPAQRSAGRTTPQCRLRKVTAKAASLIVAATSPEAAMLVSSTYPHLNNAPSM
jgi:hypothetical protein